MYAGLYGGAYERERGRQAAAPGQSINLRQQQFAEQGTLAAAGRDEFQYAQLALNDLVQRFNFEQYEPYERLGAFQNFITGGSGLIGGNTSATSSSSPGGAQIAGLALGALGGLGGG